MSAIPPAELARITAPTTLIWGREDLAIPLAIPEEASDRYGWPLTRDRRVRRRPPGRAARGAGGVLHAVLAEPEPERVQTAGGAA